MAPAAADAGRQPAGKRAPLAATLLRVDIVHEVPAEERTSPSDTPMVVIGEEVSEQLDIVPMRVRVLRHVRKRYGCPSGTHAPRTAALPPQPLTKSNASANFLAMLLVVKFPRRFAAGAPSRRGHVTLLMCGRFDYLTDRYSEPNERALKAIDRHIANI